MNDYKQYIPIRRGIPSTDSEPIHINPWAPFN